MSSLEKTEFAISEEQLAAWIAPAATEQIGDFTYSLRKTDNVVQMAVPKLSRKFAVGVPVAVLLFVAAGRWTVDQIGQGNFVAGNIFIILTFVLLYGSMIVAIVVKKIRDRSAPPVEAELPPAGIPAHAIATLARVSGQGRSLGWLWFEADEMCFRGIHFDFRLKRSDIRGRGPSLKLLRVADGLRLVRPKGISAFSLRLFPGVLSGGRFTSAPKLLDLMAADLAAWDMAPVSTIASLFPPLRPTAYAPLRLGVRELAYPAAYMAGLMVLVGFVIPQNPFLPPRSPFGLALPGALFGLMWPFLLWIEYVTQAASRREVEKVIRRLQEK